MKNQGKERKIYRTKKNKVRRDQIGKMVDLLLWACNNYMLAVLYGISQPRKLLLEKFSLTLQNLAGKRLNL